MKILAYAADKARPENDAQCVQCCAADIAGDKARIVRTKTGPRVVYPKLGRLYPVQTLPAGTLCAACNAPIG